MLTKYCSADIIEVKRAPAKGDNIRMSSFEHLPQETFQEDDDYLYVKVRAISSRVNKNYDSWPAYELAGMEKEAFDELVKKLDSTDKTSSKSTRVFTANALETREGYGYKTFSGRPVFVDHHNSDPDRARGVVVDAVLHVEPSDKKYSTPGYWSGPEAESYHKPETWIELLMEIDAKSFPKLAAALESGDIDSVSMGASVQNTECNICAHVAETQEDFCHHIANKGNVFFSQLYGKKKVAAEICHDVSFFEISNVFVPADPTAVTTEPVKPRKVKRAKTANLGYPSKQNSKLEWVTPAWDPDRGPEYYRGSKNLRGKRRKSGSNEWEPQVTPEQKNRWLAAAYYAWPFVNSGDRERVIEIVRPAWDEIREKLRRVDERAEALKEMDYHEFMANEAEFSQEESHLEDVAWELIKFQNIIQPLVEMYGPRSAKRNVLEQLSLHFPDEWDSFANVSMDREERPGEQVEDIRNKWNVGERDESGRLKWTKVASPEYYRGGTDARGKIRGMAKVLIKELEGDPGGLEQWARQAQFIFTEMAYIIRMEEEGELIPLMPHVVRASKAVDKGEVGDVLIATRKIYDMTSSNVIREERPGEQVSEIRNKWNVGERDERGRLKWVTSSHYSWLEEALRANIDMLDDDPFSVADSLESLAEVISLERDEDPVLGEVLNELNNVIYLVDAQDFGGAARELEYLVDVARQDSDAVARKKRQDRRDPRVWDHSKRLEWRESRMTAKREWTSRLKWADFDPTMRPTDLRWNETTTPGGRSRGNNPEWDANILGAWEYAHRGMFHHVGAILNPLINQIQGEIDAAKGGKTHLDITEVDDATMDRLLSLATYKSSMEYLVGGNRHKALDELRRVAPATANQIMELYPTGDKDQYSPIDWDEPDEVTFDGEEIWTEERDRKRRREETLNKWPVISNIKAFDKALEILDSSLTGQSKTGKVSVILKQAAPQIYRENEELLEEFDRTRSALGAAFIIENISKEFAGV